MGIAYLVDFPNNSDDNFYINTEWADIRWVDILELANINLAVIYDNAIDFWSNDQLVYMLGLICCIHVLDPGVLYDDQKITLALELRQDVATLIERFRDIVEKGARIKLI